MNAARANLLDTMGEFVNQRDPKSADAEALKAHIDAIAASIPMSAKRACAADRRNVRGGKSGRGTCAIEPKCRKVQRTRWDMGPGKKRL